MVTSNKSSTPIKSGHDAHVIHTRSSNTLIAGSAYSGILLLCSWGLLKFSGIIDHQASALAKTVPILIIIRLLYCIYDGMDSLSVHERSRKKHTKSAGSRLVVALLATVIALIMSFLILALLILFGAPYDSFLLESLLCAMHISLLSVQPLVYIYGLDSNLWRQVISTKLPLDGVYGASVGTWIGAWAGAIPIPLDWDRPWQQWPITILIGAYLGTAIGVLYGAFYDIYKSPKSSNKKIKSK